MLANLKVRALLAFVLLMLVVVAGSMLSMQLWGGKAEKLPTSKTLIMQDAMTLAEFGAVNQLSSRILESVFDASSPTDLQRTIQSLASSPAAISAKVNQALAFEAEEASKNWQKIAVKFIAWIIFLAVVFRLLKQRKITPPLRKALLLGAIVLFGVILGSDPSPMGTVKDAIVLLGKSHIIFPPRMVALFVMLLGGTLLANKLLCSWGCQIGTLQELIFRLGRDTKDRKALWPHITIPFAISNSIRIGFFGILTIAAFVWASDIVDPIDPFKIFNPAALEIAGIIFITGLCLASLFIYRPWCHLFCPFGLVGWLVEKISVYKIQVNYATCIACDACVKACPSSVMKAILKRQETIPDCFACGTCLDVCPTRAIEFKAGKRQLPPAGKFLPTEKPKNL